MRTISPIIPTWERVNKRYASPLKGIDWPERKARIKKWYDDLPDEERQDIDDKVVVLMTQVTNMGPLAAIEAIYQAYAYMEYLVKTVEGKTKETKLC